MPADERTRSGVSGMQVSEPSASLEPVRPLRTSLRGADGSLSATSLGVEVHRLEEELAAVRKSLRAQRAETRVEKQNNELLRSELAALRRRYEPKEEGSVTPAVPWRADGLAQDLKRLRDEYEERERQLEMRCVREIAQIEEKQVAKLSALRDSLRVAEELTLAKTERIRRLEDRLQRLQSEGVMAPAPGAQRGSADRDDLTKLRGVGPAYVHALRREGVVTFSQIAVWTFDDVREIAPKIGTTQGRIFRDDWVGQAKNLLRDRPAGAKIR